MNAASLPTARTRLSAVSRIVLAVAVLMWPLLVGAAVVLNAAICGVLSGPFPRYEARLIWLIPAVALLAGRTLAAPTLARVRTSLTGIPSSKSTMGDPAT